MNHAISGEILVQEVRFPRSEIFLATLVNLEEAWHDVAHDKVVVTTLFTEVYLDTLICVEVVE